MKILPECRSGFIKSESRRRMARWHLVPYEGALDEGALAIGEASQGKHWPSLCRREFNGGYVG